ncbi:MULTISPECIES: hypothetical protein [Tepidanaerobacter]|uniref:hypothetical protein n=1 Tax=Tepidanaerobacter TaxID=499228 RepID=UPI000A61C0BA|nr:MULTISPECIES: hypothetical protein [Tepidanaerobacter]
MTLFEEDKCDNASPKSGTILYNLIFPIWVFPFIPARIPIVFVVNFVIDAAVIWLYLKKHKKLNNPKIYCFRAFGSEKTTQPQIDNRMVLRYSFRAALFGYFADFLGGMLMVGLLETARLAKYIDTYFVWSNFVSGLMHILVTLLVGFLIYKHHRRVGKKRLNLSADEARGLGLAVGILTAPWFFLIPTAWLY